ncbi:hypothetical protein Val02_65850 [Virgisporangium aliadipatigenens]|uniref:Uncharacterized protein n=1 Tax=Virgisporangium aliadipatigenens TaxID=741659 RepID=A0A8J3YQ20_9ACTN|nr:hypothetical protein Val02_65850 [Virgisporangium aliadipatigenens]
MNPRRVSPDQRAADPSVSGLVSVQVNGADRRETPPAETHEPAAHYHPAAFLIVRVTDNRLTVEGA